MTILGTGTGTINFGTIDGTSGTPRASEGVISGPATATVTKQGMSFTAVMNGKHTYLGNTVIDGGTLSTPWLDAIGNPSGIGAGSGLTFGTTTAGTLQYTASGSVPFDRNITVNTFGGTFDVTNTEVISGSPNGAVQNGNIATITVAAAHNLTAGQSVTIAGVAPDTRFNGTFTILTVPSNVSFTYTIPTTGLTASGGGTVNATLNLTGGFSASGPLTLARGNLTRNAPMTLPAGLVIGTNTPPGAATNSTNAMAMTVTGASLSVGTAVAGTTFTIDTAANGGATYATPTATLKTTAVHGFVIGQQVFVSGVAAAGYDGPWVITAVPTTTTFSFTAPAGLTWLTTSGGGTVTVTGTGIAASATGATEAGNIVTITTLSAAPHGLSVGQLVALSGIGVAGYNGVFTVATVPSATTFTYVNPAAGLAASGGGTITNNVVALGYRVADIPHIVPTLDASGTSNVTINAGTMYLGYNIGVNTTNSASGAQGILKLGTTTNNINAASGIVMGYSNSTGLSATQNSQLIFGAGSNTVQTPTVMVGESKAPANVSINAGGTLTLTGIGGVGNKTGLIVGFNNTGGTGTIPVCVFDMTGGTMIGSFSGIVLGCYASTAGSGGSQGTLTLGTSSANNVTADSVTLATAGLSTTAANNVGTLNLSGGTFAINPGGAGILVGGGTLTGVSTLNLTGGTLNMNGATIGNVSTLTFNDTNVVTALNAAITAATEDVNQVVTITATNSFSAGQMVTIQNVTPGGYNGTFPITFANSSTFQYSSFFAGLTPGTAFGTASVPIANPAQSILQDPGTISRALTQTGVNTLLNVQNFSGTINGAYINTSGTSKIFAGQTLTTTSSTLNTAALMTINGIHAGPATANGSTINVSATGALNGTVIANTLSTVTVASGGSITGAAQSNSGSLLSVNGSLTGNVAVSGSTAATPAASGSRLRGTGTVTGNVVASDAPNQNAVIWPGNAIDGVALTAAETLTVTGNVDFTNSGIGGGKLAVIMHDVSGAGTANTGVNEKLLVTTTAGTVTLGAGTTLSIAAHYSDTAANLRSASPTSNPNPGEYLVLDLQVTGGGAGVLGIAKAFGTISAGTFTQGPTGVSGNDFDVIYRDNVTPSPDIVNPVAGLALANPVNQVLVRFGSTAVTPVKIADFKANAQGAGVHVGWTAVSEFKNAGFNVYRRTADGTEWTRVNSALIAGRITNADERKYAIYDWAPAGSYDYKLESVALGGELETYANFAGPVTVDALALSELALSAGDLDAVISSAKAEKNVMQTRALSSQFAQAVAKQAAAAPAMSAQDVQPAGAAVRAVPTTPAASALARSNADGSLALAGTVAELNPNSTSINPAAALNLAVGARGVTPAASASTSAAASATAVASRWFASSGVSTSSTFTGVKVMYGAPGRVEDSAEPSIAGGILDLNHVLITREGITLVPLALTNDGLVVFGQGYQDTYTDKDALFLRRTSGATAAGQVSYAQGLFDATVAVNTNTPASVTAEYTDVYFDYNYRPYDFTPWFSSQYLTADATTRERRRASRCQHHFASSGAATLTVNLWSLTQSATASPDHGLQVVINGQAVGQVVWSRREQGCAVVVPGSIPEP